jgi:uncharacterized cupin superfamily protein
MPEPTEPWSVVNVTEKPWEAAPGWGRSVTFDTRDAPFPDFGINIHVLEPGERSTMYHGEGGQEGYLVLSGSPTLIVEGEERVLKPWDYAHFPAWTRHALANTTAEPCAVLMTGTRTDGEAPDCVYAVDPAAEKHGASVAQETQDSRLAYAERPQDREEPYRPGTLPGA